MIKNATKRTAGVIRVLSYVFLLLQWLWVVVLYSSLIIETGAVQSYIDATQAAPSPQQQFSVELPELIRQSLATILVISMIAVSVVLLFRVPKRATQMTIRATKITVKSISPTVQKLVHVPKKQRKQFTEAVLVGVIFVMSVLACVIILPIISSLSLSVSAVWFVSIWLLILTVSMLLVSTFLSYLSRDHTRK